MPTPRITRRGYRLFLNPYPDLAFTRCPQCQRPTKLRKYHLVVHVEPAQLLVLYKRCRFCEGCDLLIVKQDELESLMVHAVEQHDPDLVGNDYLLVGTLDNVDGRRVLRGAAHPREVVDLTNVFRAQVEFEPPRWEWVPSRGG